MIALVDLLLSRLFLLLGIVFTVSYIVIGAIRRLYFSPLAKFPGPKLSALTFWVEFYYDVLRRGKYTFEIVKMHEKYGGFPKNAPQPVKVTSEIDG